MSKKLLSVGVMLALVATVLVGVGATTASAQATNMCAVVEALITAGAIAPDKVAAAKAAAGCTAAATGSYTFTRSLTIGSTGADVTALQTLLGVTPATGYFGNITKAAVIAYQTANGITPAAGYVGPITLAKLNAGAAVVVPPATGALCPNGMLLANNCQAAAAAPTALTGNAGDITVSSLSTYSGEEVMAGDESVKVLGLEVEADDGSDVEITSMKVELKQTYAGSSKRVTDYVDSVDIYMGSTKVGSADAADFSENTKIYTKSISLTDAVVKAGAKAKFYVALTAVSSLDSGDIDLEVFSVDVLSSRFVDGDGVTSTNTDLVTARLADFVDLSTSGSIEAKISKNTASPLTDKVIEVNDVSNTNDVLLLAVNLKATGSDLTVDELDFDITPTGANANVIVNEYRLLVDGTEVASLSPTSIADGATGHITFTGMADEFVVTAGDTAVVKLVADINDTEGTVFVDGDSILASLTSTNFALASSSVQDVNGDDVLDADRAGSVTGKTMSFYATGMIVTAKATVAADAVVFDTDANAANTARGDFKIRFSVEAMGMDVYLDKGIAESSSTNSTAAGDNRVLVIKTGTGATVTNVALGSLQAVDASDVTSGTYTYMVAEGDTVDFVLSVSSDLDPDAELQAVLYGLEWGNGDTATGDSVYNFNMGVNGSYKSPTVIVAD